MKLKLPFIRTNQEGFSHVEAFVALVIIGAVALIGVRVLNASHAAVVNGSILVGGHSYINPDGTGLRPISDALYIASLASTSDGTKVAYVAGSSLTTPITWSLKAANADGTQIATVLSSTTNAFYNPSWSPDKTKIAYEKDNTDGSTSMSIVTVATSLTISIPNTKYASGYPAWSPDGKSLAYSSSMTLNGASQNALCTIHLDGTGLKCFSEYPTGSVPISGGASNAAGISWSPDGSKIAFTRVKSTALSNWSLDVASMKIDGTGLKTIASNAVNPAFSPDGTRVVYDTCPAAASTNLCNGQAVLTVANADGTAPVAIRNITSANNHALTVDNNQWLSLPQLGYAYYPITPIRVADTRTGSGQPYDGKTLAAGQSLAVQIEGLGGVPASGVTAVVVNITEASATATTYLSVYPDGSALPKVSVLNASANQVLNNQTTAKLGADGKLAIYNAAGSTNVLVDVLGYYSTYTAKGNTYTPLSTFSRVVDTRVGSGKPYAGKTLVANVPLAAQIAGVGGVPATATAVAVQATVVSAPSSGYIQLYPAGVSRPLGSSLNYPAGQTLTKQVTVGLGASPAGAVNIVSTGSVNVTLDVEGYYMNSNTGSVYVPMDPVRVVDTRTNSGLPYAGQHLIYGSSSLNFNVPQAKNVYYPQDAALDANLTTVNATNQATLSPLNSVGTSLITTYPAQTRFNEILLPAAYYMTDKTYSSYLTNNSGSTDVILDLLGYFYGYY